LGNGVEVFMGKVAIRDNSIWLRHVEGDPALTARLAELLPGATIDLEVDGIVGRWERMKAGKDGRTTEGIKPIAEMRQVWAAMQRQRGRIVDIREVRMADSYLASLGPLLSEWESPEDEAAYRDL
jgi:hypothetical protein